MHRVNEASFFEVTTSRSCEGVKGSHRARSIQPKFRPVRPGKEDHLKRWTCFLETFPVGPNRSIEFWTEISGNFGWMDRALKWRGGVFLSVSQIGYPVRRHLNYFSSWVSFTRHSGSRAKSLRRGLRSRKTFLSISNFNARWRYNLNADALLSLRKLRDFSTCFCLHMTSGLYAPSLVLADARVWT